MTEALEWLQFVLAPQVINGAVDRRGGGADGARPDDHLRPARRHQHGARRVLCASAPTPPWRCSASACRSGGRWLLMPLLMAVDRLRHRTGADPARLPLARTATS